jgi:ketosteroid isomerase-like protein
MVIPLLFNSLTFCRAGPSLCDHAVTSSLDSSGTNGSQSVAIQLRYLTIRSPADEVRRETSNSHGGAIVPAKTPEEICELFKQHMAAGDIESLLSVYDPDVAFLNQSRETKRGRNELRQELFPLAAAKAKFDFSIKQVIQSGDIALMHTEWNVTSPKPMRSYAIEVARRQPDGTWRWLIGDPFTVGRNTQFDETKAA